MTRNDAISAYVGVISDISCILAHLRATDTDSWPQEAREGHDFAIRMLERVMETR